MSLGTRLKELRKKKSWSLTKTAKALGVSLSTYREWEEGRKIPVKRLVSLAEIHSTSISELLGQKQLANEEFAIALKCFETGITHVRRALAQL